MKRTFLLVVLSCILFSAAGQRKVIDSLNKVLTSNVHDTVKMIAYYELTHEYLNIDIDSAQMFAETNLKKYGSSKNLLVLSDAYAALGTVFGYKRDFEKSLVNFQKGLELLKQTGRKSAIAKAHFNIGLIYYYTSSLRQAAGEYLSALKILEEIKDKKTLPAIYSGLGGVYKDMHSYAEATRYYKKSLEMYEAAGDSVGIASAYNNIGTVLDYEGRLDDALENYQVSIRLKESINYPRGLASTLNNMGIIYSKKKEYDLALAHYNRALSFSGPNQDKMSQAVSYDGMGMVYYEKKNYSLALSYLGKSLALSNETGSKTDLISVYEKIALCYAAQGNYAKAFQTQQLLLRTKDSVITAESSLQINEMAARYESEKKQLQIENLNKDNALQAAQLNQKELEARQRNMQTLFFAIGFLLVSVLAVFIFRGYRQKRESNEIISAQKKEVELQRDLIEAKSNEITDSIFYASRIQQAVLASDALLQKNLPEYFVLHKPKDIVSGDFYWAANIRSEGDKETFYLSVADCTGHGVPGAFMSLLNISFLNQAVIEKKIQSPELILEHVRSEIIRSLNPQGSDTEGKDGMDAVVCMFDMKGMWLRFACANNPLWLIRNNELKEFAVDKMPVGMYHGEQKPFTKQTLGLRRGDIIYMLTDGYADQFGGPKGKKFKYRQLQQLLIENCALPLNKQKELLENTIEEWRGSLEQIDDILIMGIRV
ncbi:MAG TPA: tetratricopeptide repeat protein [Bacteroidia bacterium]|jgi:tetratricopeptide (TPR) repeat protein